MTTEYSSIKISLSEAEEIASINFGKKGVATPLPGELDFNFKICTHNENYILKVGRPGENIELLDFQQKILNHIEKQEAPFLSPKFLTDLKGKSISSFIDANGEKRNIRLLSWIDGRLWSEVNPKTDNLLVGLGEMAGKLTTSLYDFDHPCAHRAFEWDIAQSEWVNNHLDLFSSKKKFILTHFISLFKSVQLSLSHLRKSVVHNDVNDNNILITEDIESPKIRAIIDYGDAIYTQSINDLAVTIAYAVMGKPDPLEASLQIVAGYHKFFTLNEEELSVLYVLVAMRLVISLTKSAINKQKEPDNSYLLISEKPAWELLERWIQVNKNLAYFSYREACGFSAHPKELEFNRWSKQQNLSLKEMFPSLDSNLPFVLNMGIDSSWLGHEMEYNDNDFLDYKISRLQQQNKNHILAGGYLEVRPFYLTDAYKKEGNNGFEYRSVHLGIDFWSPALTPVHAIFDGVIRSIYNNNKQKDYGPTLILEHQTPNEIVFYSLYGHLSESSLALHQEGKKIKKGDLLAYIGNGNENGSWAPHLHFQLMLDRLGYKNDFPGVCVPDAKEVWKSICPSPNLFFKHSVLSPTLPSEDSETIKFRKNHLGKSLSLSYDKPLKILRGQGAYLMDNTGRKYLDTVNNVAHLGHEHPRIVLAGQKQMALLNTNTRYLHDQINTFAKELLSTFPPELSVVHFVNSGSEANELALRMAYAFTGEKDILAVEVGYHGNTNGCVNISSYKFDGSGGNGAPEHTHIVPLPDSYRGIYQGLNTAHHYASHIQEQIDAVHKKNRGVAAFICESIISCGGQIELPEGYLSQSYEAIRKAGGLCIADEVQTGCGRMGKTFWGFQLHDVIPDIVTIGKPIGNGHPLAAVVCSKKVSEAFANGMEYFNTFGGNPVSCAIGNEVLRVIKEERLQENALLAGAYLKNELMGLQQQFSIIGDVRGQGLFLGFELVDYKKNPLPKHASYLVNRMKQLGILMSTDGKDHNAIKIKPPMVFSLEHCNELISRLKIVFAENFMMHHI